MEAEGRVSGGEGDERLRQVLLRHVLVRARVLGHVRSLVALRGERREVRLAHGKEVRAQAADVELESVRDGVAGRCSESEPEEEVNVDVGQAAPQPESVPARDKVIGCIYFPSDDSTFTSEPCQLSSTLGKNGGDER